VPSAVVPAATVAGFPVPRGGTGGASLSSLFAEAGVPHAPNMATKQKSNPRSSRGPSSRSQLRVHVD
jgi:hypothetical protein